MSIDSDSKEKQSGGHGYSYGAGTYAGYSAAGYGYGEETGGAVQRTLQDYLLILRERIWYIVVVFLVIFSSALVYTLSQTKIYQANASVQIFRSDPTVMQVKQVVDTDVRSTEDINTQIKVIESGLIVTRVADALQGAELEAFLAPYRKADREPPQLVEVLTKNRTVALQRLTLFVQIGYKHPDRNLAARVANLFAEAYIEYNKALRSEASAKAVEDLQGTITTQRTSVERLAKDLQTYKEERKMPSLDGKKDIVSESLKSVNTEATRAQFAMAAAQIKLDQIRELQAKNGDLTKLAFIASQPLISDLTQKFTTQKIAIGEIEKRYRAQHPTMIQAVNQLQVAEQQLNKAIADACDQVEAEYRASASAYEQARQELAKRSEESLDLDRMLLDYTNRERELRTQEQLLQEIIARQTETSMSGGFATQNARIVDRAVPPREDKPIFPNIPLNLGLGLVGLSLIHI